MKDEASAATAAYETKRVDFRFRSKTMNLALSHALFSSADVDAGTRFLLRALSRLWDEDLAAGESVKADGHRTGRVLPRTILDAGCGIGVIGIAAALGAEGVRDLRIRAQDRDELAAVFTTENARRNGIPADTLAAFAEPLLAGPPGARWDLIVSNVPAKAGSPVLADFFFRSARLLTERGRVLVVVVNPLAGAARAWIAAAGATVRAEEKNAEHTVFAFGRPTAEIDSTEPTGDVDHLAASADPFSFPGPAYARTVGDFVLEGTAYRISALYGVADFDEPSRAAVLTAKLLAKSNTSWRGARSDGLSVLVHECDQGHFPAWFAARAAVAAAAPPRITLVGRNVLALAAALKNTETAAGKPITALASEPAASRVNAMPAVDLEIAADRILAAHGSFDLIVSFPEAVPRVDRVAASWAAAERLLAHGGLFVTAQASTAAERHDRAKPRGFSRAGEVKRDGFRALAYRRSPD